MSAKNVCNCPNPPGGTHSCPADHVAVCRVKDGVAHGDCYPASDEMRRLIQSRGAADPSVQAWLLKTIFPGATAHDFRSRFEADFLGGRIVDRETDEEVRFALPGRGDRPGAMPSDGLFRPIDPLGFGHRTPVGQSRPTVATQEMEA